MNPRLKSLIQRLESLFLSDRTRHRGEKVIMTIAISGFLIHLVLIGLVYGGWLEVQDPNKLLISPISALYTPFSFILVYEVFLLVFYIPQSTTSYVGKQYEIITLIVIRRIFKDLGSIEISDNWFSIQEDIRFTYDIVGVILLFLLIYAFYRMSRFPDVVGVEGGPMTQEVKRFVDVKKIIAVLLIPTLGLLGIYSFGSWTFGHFQNVNEALGSFSDVNNIFYDEFFSILVMTDVLLLLFSFIYNDGFSTVMRNSGFIISTVLIKLSFGTSGLNNTILIVVAVLFGVIILGIYRLYYVSLEKQSEA